MVVVAFLPTTSRVRAAEAPATVPADDVEAGISQIEAMKPPRMEEARLNDAAYRESFQQQSLQFAMDRSDKINALYTRFPQNPKVKTLMLDRWLQLARFGEKDQVIRETTPILAATSDPAARIDLLYVRAEAWAWPQMFSKQAIEAVDEFLKAAPDDVRGGELLFCLAAGETDPHKQAQIYRRAAADIYASSPYASVAAGKALQADAIGKPLQLSFNDFTSGKPLSVQKDLKGKIVVIIFWATWCGPCRAQLPEEKRIYAAFKDRGVEFIGVSLDQTEKEGGAKALRSYLTENPIPWPQYYQGNGVASEFSSKLGVVSIPQIFVIDREGKFTRAAEGMLEIALNEMLAVKQSKPH